MTFDREKPEWCGYQMMKKIEDTFIRFDRIHERDVLLSLPSVQAKMST